MSGGKPAAPNVAPEVDWTGYNPADWKVFTPSQRDFIGRLGIPWPAEPSAGAPVAPVIEKYNKELYDKFQRDTATLIAFTKHALATQAASTSSAEAARLTQETERLRQAQEAEQLLKRQQQEAAAKAAADAERLRQEAEQLLKRQQEAAAEAARLAALKPPAVPTPTPPAPTPTPTPTTLPPAPILSDTAALGLVARKSELYKVDDGKLSTLILIEPESLYLKATAATQGRRHGFVKDGTGRPIRGSLQLPGSPSSLPLVWVRVAKAVRDDPASKVTSEDYAKYAYLQLTNDRSVPPFSRPPEGKWTLGSFGTKISNQNLQATDAILLEPFKPPLAIQKIQLSGDKKEQDAVIAALGQMVAAGTTNINLKLPTATIAGQIADESDTSEEHIGLEYAVVITESSSDIGRSIHDLPEDWQ
jgi:hypothetical protein